MTDTALPITELLRRWRAGDRSVEQPLLIYPVDKGPEWPE